MTCKDDFKVTHIAIEVSCNQYIKMPFEGFCLNVYVGKLKKQMAKYNMPLHQRINVIGNILK